MRRGTSLALLCALAVPVGTAAAQQRQTVQQQFDAAQAAIDARNWAEALRLLDALEIRAGSNARTVGLVRVRRGGVLIGLGRLDDAAAAIRLGLPALPADDATLTADRFTGLLNLGLIAEHDLDYSEALRNYRIADALTVSSADRLLLRRGIIQTQLFTNVEAALADADAALRLAAEVAPDNRALAGEVHTLKGRALLNLGRFAEARSELETAMRLLGNLTTRVDRADLLVRSDLAIAALRAGDPDAARRYLAHTGAGLFPRGRFVLNDWRGLPQCSAALGPDDVVVVEAVLGEDGAVADAKPIYASRQGPGAIALAHAVRRWSFDADALKSIPALFRTVVRLEVRCRQGVPPDRYAEDNAVLGRLAAADPEWERALALRADRPAAAVSAELAALEAAPGPQPRAMLPLLLILADRPQLPKTARDDYRRRGLQMAAALSAPAPVLASIALDIGKAQLPMGPPGGRNPDRDFAALLAMPEIAGSPEAGALVRLAQARAHYRHDEPDQALALAREIRALPEARAGSGIATEALEIDSAVHALRGQLPAARAAHEAIGAGADRCGLPATPKPLRTTYRDFPNDALRWGFEGWAVNEMSIAPDGVVAGSRTIVAYPPFIFGDATAEVSRRARYQPVYVPDGRPCVGDIYRVTFLLPAR
ncbi:MAG TPA: hypothetical protein VMS43_14745 [Allosphingosinicella sp.]|nr:hypothetical protein [Allosphingosinicella sp.]